ncbi:MAG: cytochrome c oxidase accessory protein CcoG [Hyphomicrobiales bacterium]|nr:cytochrome c oxidase accessory protein CcoG [Hyphomicrobiales bacterium]
MLTKEKPAEDTPRVENFDAEAVNSKENRSLYEARRKIHPKRATGWFRSFKWWIMGITLGIYYLTPWLRWERGADAPDQAVLVDLANRRFYFFFIEIWPHEFFFVAGMLVMAGIGLFLVTSTLGRAWCGYTCPQTVWVDLYLVVERYFEGDRNARIKLDAAPWSASKITKRTLKHIVWILIGFATGGAWIFYFADAPTLAVNFFTGQAPFVAYATVGVLTATTYIFGGFMREQVCTYMCPWPRIQAAMLDEHSLTVTYNDWRGEPRDRHAKRRRQAGEFVGDCVDCNACVAVCPMGIDIRHGQQMECITCALCIDACDGVMDKLGLEKGLISYATLEEYGSNMQLASGRGDWVSENGRTSQIFPENVRGENGRLIDKVKQTNLRSFVRPRTILYAAIYAAIGVALLWALAVRDTLKVNILHDRNPVFTVLSNGAIRNGYEIKILNMTGTNRSFLVTIEGLEGATLKLAGAAEPEARSLRIEARADKLQASRVFVRVPKDRLDASKTAFSFNILAIGGEDKTKAGAHFEAPDHFDK